MKTTILFLLGFFALAGCNKPGNGRIDILLVDRYTLVADTNRYPFFQRIEDPVVTNIKLVANEDILYYSKGRRTFKLLKDVHVKLEKLGPDKGFVVLADGQPVYFGTFHPAYLSSIRIGIATINSSMVIDNDLPINYLLLSNEPELARRDKRNDPRILRALQESGRLR